MRHVDLRHSFDLAVEALDMGLEAIYLLICALDMGFEAIYLLICHVLVHGS